MTLSLSREKHKIAAAFGRAAKVMTHWQVINDQQEHNCLVN